MVGFQAGRSDGKTSHRQHTTAIFFTAQLFYLVTLTVAVVFLYRKVLHLEQIISIQSATIANSTMQTHRREKRNAISDIFFEDLLQTQVNMLKLYCKKDQKICLPGPKGSPGDRGPKGDNGLHGAKGEQGDHGFVGPAGHKGTRGVKGQKGSDGIKGESVLSNKKTKSSGFVDDAMKDCCGDARFKKYDSRKEVCCVSSFSSSVCMVATGSKCPFLFVKHTG